jgi:hypothetical protein
MPKKRGRKPKVRPMPTDMPATEMSGGSTD